MVVWRIAHRHAGGGERRALDASFDHQLLHDDLTKLPNRTLFRDRLERALARSVRRRQSCAVLAIDVDRFKLVGTSLGPAAGDALLRDVAARLDQSVRPEDTVARTGGDEFMVLLETVDSPADALAVADRVTEGMAPPFRVADHEVFVSVSIGAALGRGGRDRPEDVLQNADVAVQRAKDGGGARCEVFRQEMNPHPLERIGLEAELRRAVEHGEFFLEYQPEVELDTGRIVGAEALLRWRHPERGVIEPSRFVPIAEETGLILPLGRWVLEEACERAASWWRMSPAGSGPLTLRLNLSPRQFQQPRMRLVDDVASALAGSGLDAESLSLEITELAVTQDVEGGVAAMRDLKRLGVRLALDDLGTGYSSLSSLRRFSFDVAKIDRSFVGELAAGDDEEGDAVVRALVEVCHALHAAVLAEGVETLEQAGRLRELGCELGQGSCFSDPLPADELEKLIRSGRPLMPVNAGS